MDRSKKILSLTRNLLIASAVMVLCAAGAQGQAGEKPAAAVGQAQAPSAAPDCTDAVQCATECEKGSGGSCYKLAKMYQNGSSGVDKNIDRAIEFNLKACDRSTPPACNDAASALLIANKPENDKRAVELFKKGCAANEPYSCGNLGWLLEAGRGLPKDIPRAMELSNQACTRGALFACVTLGRIYQLGENGKKDEAKAASLFQQACDGENAGGCFNLGWMYLNGAGTAVPKDPKLAVPLFKRACNAGSGDGCDDLGVSYERGDGVEKDEARAAVAYQKSCDGNFGWGCNNLGNLYRDGRGVTADPARAAGLYQKACDRGIPSGCTNLGIAYVSGRGVNKDDSKAAMLYQKGCDGKDYNACVNLGFMLRDGVGITKDELRAVQMLTLACDGGDGKGCMGLAYSLQMGKGIEKDLPRAAKMYQKSCDNHYQLACANLGLMYRDGVAVSKDEKHAAELFKSACEAGEPNGCFNLGYSFEYARGVQMDDAKAAELYQKACQGSVTNACENYKRLTQENRSLLREGGGKQTVPAGAGTPAIVAARGSEGTPGAKVAIKREQWALVVGISKYGPSVGGLQYARKDAEAFYSLLRSPRGGNFQQDHILLLVDDQATSTRVRGGIRDFLGQAGKDDVVVVFFAGHGAPDPRHPNALYLLTYDTLPDHLGQSAFDMDEIRSALQKTISAERVVVYVDACHSAGISSLGTRGPANESELLNRYLAVLAQSSSGVAMFSASQANELSRESEQWGGGHGVFTFYLIQGLQGAADRDNDGIVTLQELVDYVSENVKQATKFAQHPALSTSSNWDPNIPVAILH
jgi:TPR repeat protein